MKTGAEKKTHPTWWWTELPAPKWPEPAEIDIRRRAAWQGFWLVFEFGGWRLWPKERWGLELNLPPFPSLHHIEDLLKMDLARKRRAEQ